MSCPHQTLRGATALLSVVSLALFSGCARPQASAPPDGSALPARSWFQPDPKSAIEAVIQEDTHHSGAVSAVLEAGKELNHSGLARSVGNGGAGLSVSEIAASPVARPEGRRAVREYVAFLDRLDLSRCPGDFQDAYRTHRDAWRGLPQWFDGLDEHVQNPRPHESSTDRTLEVVMELTGPLEGVLGSIQETWANVEAAAHRYGARTIFE